jgi:hypothetical protein
MAAPVASTAESAYGDEAMVSPEAVPAVAPIVTHASLGRTPAAKVIVAFPSALVTLPPAAAETNVPDGVGGVGVGVGAVGVVDGVVAPTVLPPLPLVTLPVGAALLALLPVTAPVAGVSPEDVGAAVEPPDEIAPGVVAVVVPAGVDEDEDEDPSLGGPRASADPVAAPAAASPAPPVADVGVAGGVEPAASPDCVLGCSGAAGADALPAAPSTGVPGALDEADVSPEPSPALCCSENVCRVTRMARAATSAAARRTVGAGAAASAVRAIVGAAARERT